MKRVGLGCLILVVAFGAFFSFLFFRGMSEGKKVLDPVMTDLHAKRFDAVIDRYHANLLEQVPRTQWKEWFAAMFQSVGEAKSYEYEGWGSSSFAGTSPSEEAPLGSGSYVKVTCVAQHERGIVTHEFSLFKSPGSDDFVVSRHKFKSTPR